MIKGEKIQKLVLFGAMIVGALLVAEGYLRVRTFVDRVEAADRQLVALKQEVDFLRVQLDVVPRPGVVAAPMVAATPQLQFQPPQQPLVLPIPEPMRLPVPQERPQKARVKEVAVSPGGDEPAKAEGAPVDGKIVLLKDVKESKAAPGAALAPQAVATPTVNVQLWPKK